MNGLNLVIPMAGEGARFKKYGFSVPKPLIEIHERPFFYWSVMSVKKYVAPEKIIFVALKEHAEKFFIDREIYKYFPEAEIIFIPDVLPGPVFTCMKAAESITNSLPVVFNDCDHMFKCTEFYSEINQVFNYDGGLITFKSENPAFSYVKYDIHGNIAGTVEKENVSSYAICGAYIFRDAEIFTNNAGEYINHCTYNECFMSGIYNIMCKKGLSIKIFHADYNIDFGTPEAYELAKTGDAKYYAFF